jgi:hypothetical protein
MSDITTWASHAQSIAGARLAVCPRANRVSLLAKVQGRRARRGGTRWLCRSRGRSWRPRRPIRVPVSACRSESTSTLDSQRRHTQKRSGHSIHNGHLRQSRYAAVAATRWRIRYGPSTGSDPSANRQQSTACCRCLKGLLCGASGLFVLRHGLRGRPACSRAVRTTRSQQYPLVQRVGWKYPSI